jgi:hypothetical protein
VKFLLGPIFQAAFIGGYVPQHDPTNAVSATPRTPTAEDPRILLNRKNQVWNFESIPIIAALSSRQTECMLTVVITIMYMS